jgi:hypothetical protein
MSEDELSCHAKESLTLQATNCSCKAVEAQLSRLADRSAPA